MDLSVKTLRFEQVPLVELLGECWNAYTFFTSLEMADPGSNLGLIVGDYIHLNYHLAILLVYRIEYV